MHATTVSLSTPTTTAPTSVSTPVGWHLPPLGWKDAVKVSSHTTPGTHYWLSPSQGLCTCPSCVKGGRFCRHLREYTPQPATIRVCPFCQLNPSRDFIYCSEVCAANAALRAMEDEAFAVNVIDDADRVAMDPHPERPFCHCVSCGARYNFSDFSPLLCPVCSPHRADSGIAESTEEEIAASEGVKDAVLATVLGRTRACVGCGSSFLGTAALCVDCLYPELAYAAF